MVQIDTQESPQLAARFNVRGIPVLFLLRAGKVVSELAGAQTAETVVAWFLRQR